jgi:hypothetical protein
MANRIRVWHPVAKILIRVIWARYLTNQANSLAAGTVDGTQPRLVRFTLVSAIFRLMVLSPA